MEGREEWDVISAEYDRLLESFCKRAKISKARGPGGGEELLSVARTVIVLCLLVRNRPEDGDLVALWEMVKPEDQAPLWKQCRQADRKTLAGVLTNVHQSTDKRVVIPPPRTRGRAGAIRVPRCRKEI